MYIHKYNCNRYVYVNTIILSTLNQLSKNHYWVLLLFGNWPNSDRPPIHMQAWSWTIWGGNGAPHGLHADLVIGFLSDCVYT